MSIVPFFSFGTSLYLTSSVVALNVTSVSVFAYVSWSTWFFVSLNVHKVKVDRINSTALIAYIIPGTLSFWKQSQRESAFVH